MQDAAAAAAATTAVSRSASLQLHELKRPQLSVWAWGRNDTGQACLDPAAAAALGPPGVVAAPARVPALGGVDIIALSSSLFNAAALTADGELLVWGTNESGQLGRRPKDCSEGGGDTAPNGGERGECGEYVWAPQRVAALETHPLSHVALGGGHAVAATRSGQVATWGEAEFGQLGTGQPSAAPQPQPRLLRSGGGGGSGAGGKPSSSGGGAAPATSSAAPADAAATGVVGRAERAAAGAASSFILTAGGQVYSFGESSFGVLGLGDAADGSVAAPRLVGNLWAAGVTQIACGERHAAALTVSGQLYTWGRGRVGALGQGDFESRSTPRAVAALRGVRGLMVAAGADHTLLLARRQQRRSLCKSSDGDGDVDGDDDGSNAVVYAWGRGANGATGLGHADNACLPGVVQALDGAHVVQVVCGRNHSAALGAGGAVYTWGAGESGQLGLGAAGDAGGGWRLPTAQLSPARLTAPPWGAAAPVLFLQLGGDVSFAVVQETEAPPFAAAAAAAAAALSKSAAPGARRPSPPPPLSGPHASRVHGRTLLPLAPPDVVALADAVSAAEPGGAEREAAVSRLADAVDTLFSSPGLLLGAFAADAVAPQPPASSSLPPLGLDVAALGAAYAAVLKSYAPEALGALGAAASRLLSELPRSEAWATGTSLAVPRLLLALLLNPLNSPESGGVGATLLGQVTALALKMNAGGQAALGAWAAQQLPRDVLGGRVVRPLQRYVSRLVNPGGGGLAVHRADVLALLRLLDILCAANAAAGGTVPWSDFENADLSGAADLAQEYAEWRRALAARGAGAGTSAAAVAAAIAARAPGAPATSLCELPFALTVAAKAQIVRADAEAAQHAHAHAGAAAAVARGLPPRAGTFLVLHVRRGAVLSDAVDQLAAAASAVPLGPGDAPLRRPLRVVFESNNGAGPEEGLDQGGLTREFFLLLSASIFSDAVGMFEWHDEARVHWLNPGAAGLVQDEDYLVVGALLGVALYNGVQVPLHLPLWMYKQLLGGAAADAAPTLDDLAGVSPGLARGLRQLLEYDGDVEATFCRTFEVTFARFGEPETVELVPGGAAIPVTAANRAQYVAKYAEWVLRGGVRGALDALRRGFAAAASGPPLLLLRPEELELLLAGLPHLDFAALRDGARYEGGWGADAPTVRDFWAVLSELSAEQKRAFLAFATGCDRAPVGGLRDLQLLVQRAGPDSERLPSAHTCFNALLLPDYGDRAKLRAKLLAAIGNAQGFGLQ